MRRSVLTAERWAGTSLSGTAQNEIRALQAGRRYDGMLDAVEILLGSVCMLRYVGGYDFKIRVSQQRSVPADVSRAYEFAQTCRSVGGENDFTVRVRLGGAAMTEAGDVAQYALLCPPRAYGGPSNTVFHREPPSLRYAPTRVERTLPWLDEIQKLGAATLDHRLLFDEASSSHRLRQILEELGFAFSEETLSPSDRRKLGEFAVAARDNPDYQGWPGKLFSSQIEQIRAMKQAQAKVDAEDTSER